MLSFFNNLPKPTKIFLSFAIAGFVAAGWLNKDDLPFFGAEDNNSIEIHLLILTQGNQPIQDAKILVNSQGPLTPIFSDTDGFAQIQIPYRKNVEINIEKEGYENVVKIINLEVDTSRNKKIKLKKISSLPKPSITTQYITAQNEFLPLTLSSLTPNFDIPIIKTLMGEIFNNKNPLVVKNQVFNSIDKFKIETGNDRTIEKVLGMTEHSVTTEVSRPHQIDSSSTVYYDNGKIKVTPHDGYGYLSSNLLDDGKDEKYCFFSYAPIIKSFQKSNEDSNYTAFLNLENYDDTRGNIIQYPKLSDIANHGQQSLCIQDFKDFWIRKVIENNPSFRGFIGFDYSFIFDLNNYHEGPCKDAWSLEKILPSPYIKFIDIRNNKQEPVEVNAIDYKYIKKNPYKLTVVDQRDTLFQSSSHLIKQMTQEINIVLDENHHLLVPIEFGFSNEFNQKNYQISYEFDRKKLMNMDKIYVRKPLSQIELEKLEKADANEVTRISMTSESLSQEFINEASSSKDLFDSIPEKIAVGSILNVQSVKVNGDKFKIKPPQKDGPPVYTSIIFQFGGC